MSNILQEMLLIDDPSIFRLYKELIKIANYFIAPVFTISLILEFFGQMNFSTSVKKLFLVIIFMGSFYQFHTGATQIALESAGQTLKKVSPANLFVKKWNQAKIKTKKQKGWDSLKNIIIPNLNDLIGTAFFVLAKIFIWLLKLIYSSVYHLTYVFAGFSAILYFLGWTQDALKGTVQASIWCMIMPFVIVAILSLVGNSIEATALGGNLVIAKIDTVIWLFGVTLLLLISPLISYGMIRGDGIHSFGSKMGTMVVSSGLKAMALYPMMGKMMSSVKNRTVSPLSNKAENVFKSLRQTSSPQGPNNHKVDQNIKKEGSSFKQNKQVNTKAQSSLKLNVSKNHNAQRKETSLNNSPQTNLVSDKGQRVQKIDNGGKRNGKTKVSAQMPQTHFRQEKKSQTKRVIRSKHEIKNKTHLKSKRNRE